MEFETSECALIKRSKYNEITANRSFIDSIVLSSLVSNGSVTDCSKMNCNFL